MMNSILFYAVLCLLLGTWEIELSIRFALCYRRTLQAADKLIARRSIFLQRLAYSITGFYVDIQAPPPNELPEQVMLISNHQSLLDIVLLVIAFPQHRIRFVAKKELAWGFPAISLLLRMLHHALIDRKANLSAGRKKITSLGYKAQRESISPTIFPEGTRSKTGRVGTFRTGAVKTIQSIHPLPMVVCALDGGARLNTLRSLIHLNQYSCKLHALYTTEAPQTKTETAEQMEKAQQAIAEKLETWHQEAAKT